MRNGNGTAALPRDVEAMTAEARLYAVVRDFAVKHGFERSIKLRDRSVLVNRFLLTIAAETIGADHVARVLDACASLNMSADFLAAVSRHLPAANLIHFGFEEESAGRAYYKVYLERQEEFAHTMASASGAIEPFLLHHAFKWNPADNREQVVARYVCHPRLRRDAVLTRIADVYAGQSERTPWHLLCQLLTAAGRRVPDEEILYLDVTEDGTGRRSFDVNVYRAGFTVAALLPFLEG